MQVTNERLTRYQCQNCRRLHREENLKPIRHLWQRVEPGEPMPAGECPECGMVCHEVPIHSPGPYRVTQYGGSPDLLEISDVDVVELARIAVWNGKARLESDANARLFSKSFSLYEIVEQLAEMLTSDEAREPNKQPSLDALIIASRELCKAQ